MTIDNTTGPTRIHPTRDMDIPYLSTTIINGWPTCPARSWHDAQSRDYDSDDYGDGPLAFGSIVHEVAEIYMGAEMRGETPHEPVDLFDAIWQRNQLADLDYYFLGRENIQDFLERTLFSQDEGTEVIGVEVPFLYDMDGGDLVLIDGMSEEEIREVAALMPVPVRSMIDRIDRVDENTIHVYDYKTNLQPFTRDEVENSLQLFIYDRAIRALYPEVDEVFCVFDMVRHGRFPTYFTDGKAEVLQAYIINLWYQIKNADEPQERINSYCSWCSRKHDCDEYAAAIDGKIPDPNTDELSYTEKWEHYEHLSNLRKIIKQRRKEVKESLTKAIMDDFDGRPIPIDDDRELYLQENPRYEYPPDKVFPFLKEHGMLTLLGDGDVVSISRPGIERALKGRDELEDVKKLEQTYYVSSTLKARKARDEHE